MRCRALYKEDNGKNTVVWFKSHGMTFELSEKSITIDRRSPNPNVPENHIIVPDNCLQKLSESEGRIKLKLVLDSSLSVGHYQLVLLPFQSELPGDVNNAQAIMLHPSSTVLIDLPSTTIYPYTITVEIPFDYDKLNSNYYYVYLALASSYVASPLHPEQHAYITYSFYEGQAQKVDKNFSSEQHGVADSLTQRLSVIRGELWYKMNEGMPLFDKGTTVTSMDAFVINTIMTHPDVVNIESFKSRLDGHNYSFEVKILTKYGSIELSN